MWYVVVALATHMRIPPPAPDIAPCLTDRRTLPGAVMYNDLGRYAKMFDEHPPSGRYGSCTVANGQVRDADGTLVAELTCGITAHVRGITDHLGFEVGARGVDVAAAYPNAKLRILCVPDS